MAKMFILVGQSMCYFCCTCLILCLLICCLLGVEGLSHRVEYVMSEKKKTPEKSNTSGSHDGAIEGCSEPYCGQQQAQTWSCDGHRLEMAVETPLWLHVMGGRDARIVASMCSISFVSAIKRPPIPGDCSKLQDTRYTAFMDVQPGLQCLDSITYLQQNNIIVRIISYRKWSCTICDMILKHRRMILTWRKLFLRQITVRVFLQVLHAVACCSPHPKSVILQHLDYHWIPVVMNLEITNCIRTVDLLSNNTSSPVCS